MVSQPEPEYLRFNPLPETRQVDARFYGRTAEDEPLFVLIDGVAYRREWEQERLRLGLAFDEVHARLLRMIGPEVVKVLQEMRQLEEKQAELERETLQKELTGFLPNHEPVIAHVFDPEGTPLFTLDAQRHAQCRLPLD